MNSKIFLGIGANLKFDKSISIQDNCSKVIQCFEKHNIVTNKISNWYKSAPVPLSDQPWYVNTVVEVSTVLEPKALMDKLHAIENLYGRRRKNINDSRTIDIDIIDYNGLKKNKTPTLPHPRMHSRLFVLQPLFDIEPNWTHPILKKQINHLIDLLNSSQEIQKIF